MLDLKMKGSIVHILKEPVKVNEILDFQAVDSLNNLNIIKFSDFLKTKKIISSVPSIDTSVCSIQTEKFNSNIAKEFSDYIVVTISKDLPFAQTRFCKNLKLNSNFHILSDYRNDLNNFANKTNLVIDENQLLARAIMILDENNKILYQQIVSEIASEPDYDEVLNFIKKLK